MGKANNPTNKLEGFKILEKSLPHFFKLSLGKKERSRKLNKTVEINAPDILSNIAPKISHAIATNYPKNAGVVTTASKTSENRKTGGNLTITNTTEQPTAAFAKIFTSRCVEFWGRQSS